MINCYTNILVYIYIYMGVCVFILLNYIKQNIHNENV